jgi:tetracycline repressor-like protein
MREVIGPVAHALGTDEPELRVSLVGSQIIGLMMARYIAEVEPLASQPADRVADLIAPTLQHYLTNPLTPRN